MHYVGLSRVTIEGLYITELCENKITVSSEVEKHMKYLRTEGKLELCISPVYNADERAINVRFLNACSLHKHIDDVRADLNYLKTDINIFSETRFSNADSNTMYQIGQRNLVRNDDIHSDNGRPYGGTAVYSRVDYYPGYPFCCKRIEIIAIRLMVIPHITIIGIYRSPRVPVSQFLHCSKANTHAIFNQV